MRRILLALLFSMFAVPAFAVCPSPLTGKDAAGTTQNFGDTVDGSGNCYGNVGIVDGAAAANKMSVKAASTAAAQTDLAAVVRNPDVGTISDTAYAGSGNSTLSAALRGIYAVLANILTAVQAAIPAGTNVIGYTSNDPCAYALKTNVAIATSAGNLQLVAGVSAKKVYICSAHIIAAAAAVINVIEGTGAACTTANEAAIWGSTTAASGESYAANGGMTYGNGAGTVGVTATAANGVCLLQSGTTALAGNITYVQQ